MNQIFKHREDWFEVGVAPAIRRRTIIGALLLGLCIAAWLNWESWVPLGLAVLVLAERVFEFAHIRRTKEIIASLNVRVNDSGLALSMSGAQHPIIYTWPSLSYKVVNSSSGAPKAILIKDRARKNSNLKLVGFERMNELVDLIKHNAKKP